MFYIQYAQGVECKHYLSVLSDHRTFNTKSSMWYLEQSNTLNMKLLQVYNTIAAFELKFQHEHFLGA